MHRRRILQGIGAGAVTVGTAGVARAAGVVTDPGLPAGLAEAATLEALPGKNKLIKLSYRPPNYEAPLAAFHTPITANADFFVRYHLAGLPEMDALKNWSLKVAGDAAQTPLTFTLDQLKAKFKHAEITAVCQCSGNRRGYSDPHVPGVEWGVGAMGNARWTGVRLKDVLAATGIKAGAVELILNGADGPVLPETPNFVKSLPIEKAQDENILIAWAMNGQPLPFLNGFPARLVVPGWTATYWMKHIVNIDISSKPNTNFWMHTVYRVPAGMFPAPLPFASQDDGGHTTPITEIIVNSLITAPVAGARLGRGGFEVRGIAWDGGSGIKSVEVSVDGGKTWKPATLGQDLGRFAFRPFGLHVAGLSAGPASILARATNGRGDTQAEKLKFNPAGYHNNVPRAVAVTVA
jgi:sulfite dehydrogenase